MSSQQVAGGVESPKGASSLVGREKNLHTRKMISSTDVRDYEEFQVRSQHKVSRGGWVAAEMDLAMVTEMVLCEDTVLKAKLSHTDTALWNWIKPLGSKRNCRPFDPRMGKDLMHLKNR